MSVAAPPPSPAGGRRWLGSRTEIVVVLACSLGASAAFSLLTIAARLTSDTPLSEQTATLNARTNDRAWVDVANQLLGIAADLAPVALVLLLLSMGSAVRGDRRIGLTPVEPWRDLRRAAALLALIGVPGILVYALGRELGVTAAVVAAPLDGGWWTVPLLVLSAARAGILEEVIVVGYLCTRLAERGWRPWTILAASAVLRGSYHLYQGIGPFFGNVVMGVVFAWCFRRWGRVLPLVVAHTMIDIVSFVGYPLAASLWPGVFAPPAG